MDFLVEVPPIALPGLLDDLIERGFTLDPTIVIKQHVWEHVASVPFRGIRIDWLKPVLPLYARTLTDASLVEWSEGHTVRVTTAEGLILTKMVAVRAQNHDPVDRQPRHDRHRPHPRGMVFLRRLRAGADVRLEGEIDRLVIRRE